MSRFAPHGPADIAALIREEVLGLVTTCDAAGFIATPLPLLAELDETGEVRALIGHFARSNPHAGRAQASPRALISFLGPHGYISPTIVSKPGWGPTWNYRLAQFEVEIEFQPERGDIAIRALVDALEGAGAGAWTVDRMGPRYDRLVDHVIAFRAHVIGAHACFKLGQDEDPTTFDEILTALGDAPLAAAMRSQADG